MTDEKYGYRLERNCTSKGGRMNREERHVYLVMYEKISKKSKRDLQSLLARKNVPNSVSINALVKVLGKAMRQNAEATLQVLLESAMEVPR